LRPSIWTRQLGPDYIPIALKTTARVDPSTRLVLNEYDLEYQGDRFAARRDIALLQVHPGLGDGLPRTLIQHDNQPVRAGAHYPCLNADACIGVGSTVSLGKHPTLSFVDQSWRFSALLWSHAR